jgi:hypothetical protein
MEQITDTGLLHKSTMNLSKLKRCSENMSIKLFNIHKALLKQQMVVRAHMATGIAMENKTEELSGQFPLTPRSFIFQMTQRIFKLSRLRRALSSKIDGLNFLSAEVTLVRSTS